MSYKTTAWSAFFRDGRYQIMRSVMHTAAGRMICSNQMGPTYDTLDEARAEAARRNAAAEEAEPPTHVRSRLEGCIWKPNG